MRAEAQINDEAQLNYKIKIDSISLYVRKITPLTACHLGIIAGMKHATLKYPIRRVKMCMFSIPHQAKSCTQENMMLGQLPHHVDFFFVGTNEVHG